MINNNPNWCNDPLTLIGIVGTGSLERGLRCSYQRMLQKFADAARNNSLPGYFGIMATRHVQFCCIFAVTKDYF